MAEEGSMVVVVVRAAKASCVLSEHEKAHQREIKYNTNID